MNEILVMQHEILKLRVHSVTNHILISKNLKTQ